MDSTGTLVSNELGLRRGTKVSMSCCIPFLRDVKSGGAGLVIRARHFFSGGQHGAAEAAVSALHFGKARKNGADAEAGGFSAVDAGEERVGEAVDHF